MNFDATPLSNLVWLITKGPPETNQTSGNYQGGALRYRRLQWNTNNGTVGWTQGDEANWHQVADPQSSPYRSYFDLDGGAIGAPQMGGPTTIALGPAGAAVGSRLSMAVIRDSTLWTCHHVGLDGVDGDFDGNGTGSTVDRSAIQWFRLHITGTGDLELQNSNDQGRIMDIRTSQTPNWYFFPSLMVNSAQDVVIGFSGSSCTSYVGAYYSWRRGPCTAMEGPVLIKAGEGYFDNSRWGDYSCTSLDPLDGTLWTVQEYAIPSLYLTWWGTWIARILISD